MKRPCIVRPAVPADIPVIMRLKLALATAEGIAWTVQATAADWARDAFGDRPYFSVFIAECDGIVAGMAITAERRSPGWVGPLIVLSDLYVEPAFRGRGVATALLARVAALARGLGSVMVELTVRTGNRAAALYERLGFIEVPEARHYVLAGPALAEVAGRGARRRAADPVA
jgi:ribosomal protein S18 acetylase RimI-like enzyme